MESRALLATAKSPAPPAALRTKPERGLPRPRLRLPQGSRATGGPSVLRRTAVGRSVCAEAPRFDLGGEGFEAFGGGEEGKRGWIHFVGIGGSGLSALAMLALKQGFEVSGSDIMWSSFMDELRQAGAILYLGHSTSNLETNIGSPLPNAVVISSAIPADNEEVAHAKAIGIPTYKRDVWLRKITEQYNLIAISGTHGKSTTAAMLSYVLETMGDNLIAVVGAHVPQFSGGNIIPGSGPNFVLEADEYDCCFLELSPSIAVVTNVEWDHVDIFPDEEAVSSIFKRFVDRIRVGGHLILCGDCAGACNLLSESSPETVSSSKMMPSPLLVNHGYKITTFGISRKNEWHASSITPNLQGGQDYVLYHKELPVTRISISLPGVHNVLNSLAVIATVTTLFDGRENMHDIISSMKYHLSNFKGVSRRFELIGKVHGCHVYDDYAHHPTEVRAVLQAARQKFPSQALWVVFQPHTFSRLAALMKDFSIAFTDADYVIVTEIYAAREMNDWNTDGSDLATSIRGLSSEYIPKMEDVIDKLLLEIPSNGNGETVVITLGAGDITTLGPKLLRRLQERSSNLIRDHDAEFPLGQESRGSLDDHSVTTTTSDESHRFTRNRHSSVLCQSVGPITKFSKK